jgi:hypothetical protein
MKTSPLARLALYILWLRTDVNNVKLRPTRLWGRIGEDIDWVWGDQSGYGVVL